MSPVLAGIGTAVPARRFSQQEAATLAARATDADDRAARALATLYRRSGVQQRHSVLGVGDGLERFYPPRRNETDAVPTTAQRMVRYGQHAAALAHCAAARALGAAGVEGRSITHLVTVSCTGFTAPGVDVQLIRRLALPATVERTHVGFMGCHGALNGMRVAASIAAADPAAIVLLCAVELCSLHFAYGRRCGSIVADALFADGAAAAVLGGALHSCQGPRVALGRGGSCIVADTEALMTWRIGDHGFEMTLSAGVPQCLQETVRPWFDGWLAGHGLERRQVRSWAIHPGGPRVLDGVAAALDLPESALAASRQILADYGNMSSPTVLFILERQLAACALPCVALGFGPGLAAEAVLLT